MIRLLLWLLPWAVLGRRILVLDCLGWIRCIIIWIMLVMSGTSRDSVSCLFSFSFFFFVLFFFQPYLVFLVLLITYTYADNSSVLRNLHLCRRSVCTGPSIH